jgi:hypothetical protein
MYFFVNLVVFFREFGEMAVKLLQYSYQDSNLNTIAFLDNENTFKIQNMQ